MRIGKILAICVGGVVALIVIGMLAVWLLVNPNDYKPRIAAAVKQATGRDLALTGDIKLSVFPWIALELGPASLGNPKGFPADQPFMSFQHAAVRVRLLPLLSKRLDVGRLDLDGLDARLLKNSAGKGNWQDFDHDEAAAPAATKPPPAKAGDALQGIAGISITHARVSYQNIVVQNMKLETGPFTDKGLVPISLHADADRGIAGEHASLDARFNFSADSTAERCAIAALSLDGTIAMAGIARPITWNVSAPAIELNVAGETFSVPKFAINAAGAEISGGIQATKIMDAPALTGSITLAPVVVREYLPRLGMTAPVTRDPKALSSVAFSGEFSYGDNAAHLTHLSATLDETHLTGSAGVVNLTTHALVFDLKVDSINLDRYLPPAATTTPAPAGAKPAPEPQPAKAEASAPLDANGTLTMGAVHFSPLDLTDVKVTVAAKDNVIHVFPLKALVDGGQYSGDITVDSRSGTPALSMDEHLSGIDVGKLVAAESKKLKVSGHGNVNIKATGHGLGADAIMKTLNGHFDANVANGAVEGMDLGFQLGRAEALLKRQDLPNTQDTHRTAFDALKLSAEITNGVAVTKDLIISSPVLKITGQGSANLPTQGLDFALLADTMKTAGNTAVKIPVKVTGTMSDPTVRPDVEALAKGELKQKVQDVVQDKLKGLFGKP